MIKLYSGKLIIKLPQENKHISVPPKILRIFEEIEIPEKYEGYLVDCCFTIMSSPIIPIASIAFAIKVATKICKKYPDF